MEHVNAVESDVKQRTGRYAAWADLVQLPQFLTSAPEELRSRLTKDPEQTIPGYVAHVETTNYGDGYIALLVDRDSGYALRSDDSGVVAIGSSLDPSTKKPSPAFVHFSRTAFAPPSK